MHILKRANFRKDLRTNELHKYYKKIRLEIMLEFNLKLQAKNINIQRELKDFHEDEDKKQENQQLKNFQNRINEQNILGRQKFIPTHYTLLSKFTVLIDSMQKHLQGCQQTRKEVDALYFDKLIEKCIKILVHVDRYIQELIKSKVFSNKNELQLKMQSISYAKVIMLSFFRQVIAMYLGNKILKNKQFKLSQVLACWSLLYLPSLLQLTKSGYQIQQQNENETNLANCVDLNYSSLFYSYRSIREELFQFSRQDAIQLMLCVCGLIQTQILVKTLNGDNRLFSKKVTSIFKQSQFLSGGLQTFIIQNSEISSYLLGNIYKIIKERILNNESILNLNNQGKDTYQELIAQFQKISLQTPQQKNQSCNLYIGLQGELNSQDFFQFC